MKSRVFMTLFLALISLVSFASELTVEEYINTYKNIAIEEMESSGIPASITLAQGILESRFGNSRLAVKGNNHFGIKCHSGWTGKRMYHDDDAKGECFRVYKNAYESYKDHTEFLETRSRYGFLFDYSSTDYKKWAHGLKSAGYATNPKYGHILINLIERHQLYVYDSAKRNVFASRNHKEKDQSHVKVNPQTNYKVPESKVYNADKIDHSSGVQVFSYNRIKTIKVGKHDDIQSIAARNDVSVSRLYKYNDLRAGQKLEVDQFIYLQPKRGKAGHKSHTVKSNETLWDISQLYGIKLNKLYARNFLKIGEEPAEGQSIYLNKKAIRKPLTRDYVSQKPPREKKEELVEVMDRAEQAMKQAEVNKVATDAEQAMKKAEQEALLKAQQEAERKAQEEAEAKRKAAEAEKARLEAEAKKQAEEARQAAEAKRLQEERLKMEAEKALEERDKVQKPVEKVTEPTFSDEDPVAVPRKSKEQIEKDRIDKETRRMTHTVVKGNTLYGLALKYNVTVAEIKKWNGLKSSALSLGQKLEIFRRD